MNTSIPSFFLYRRYWLLPLVLWAALVGFSLDGQIRDIRGQALEVSTEGARNMFQMIVMTRAWNAQHGGVYVPVNEKVHPNPYLSHPRRDLMTTDGQQLTMINPAFMTRLIAESLIRLLANADFTAGQFWGAKRDLLASSLGEHFETIDTAIQNYEFEEALTGINRALAAPQVDPQPATD